MSDPNAEKVEVDPPATQNPPPYSEKQPYREPGLSAPPMDTGAPPTMAPQYQTNYGAPGAGFNQGPILQPPQQTIVFSSVQPIYEPDYLAYSIFTMLCCCLPVGIAALVYSIKTRDANHTGNSTAARQFSRLARILSHTALGLGIGFVVLYVILTIITVAGAASAASKISQQGANSP